MSAATRRPARFGLLLLLVGLLAFYVRELFVLATIVDVPIRGDVRDYVAYALNLVQHGVYSGTYPPHPPVPDSFRMPGYPWLIALGMTLWPQGADATQLDGWYPFVLQAQVALGTATAVLVAMLARHWLRPAGAIAAGLLAALWPHHVVATGVMLSEVLFGFMLVLGCFAFARAWTTQRTAWFAVAGAAFGYAYLVNPLIALFPACVALLAWRFGARRGATWLLALFLVPVVGMALRNATLPPTGHDSGERARLNFVQGAWPQYHAAATAAGAGVPGAIAVMEGIDRESRALAIDPQQGLAMMHERMAADPFGYARWYAMEKPWMLWGWTIRYGARDLYVVDVRNSPFDRLGVLRATVAAYRWLNPLFSTLTLGAAVVLAFAAWRRPALAPLAATAGLALYVTLVHAVLQAEPRYAIAYRPLEAALVVTAIAWLIRRVRGMPPEID